MGGNVRFELAIPIVLGGIGIVIDGVRVGTAFGLTTLGGQGNQSGHEDKEENWEF